jgi:hypothetical protein
MQAKPARGSGLAWGLFSDKPGGIVCRCGFKRLSAGQREGAKDFMLLIHGEGFDSIAGKVNTCFSRARF